MPTPAAIRQRRSRESRGVATPFTCVFCEATGDEVQRCDHDHKLCALCGEMLRSIGRSRCRGCSTLTTNARYCTDCNRTRWQGRQRDHASKELPNV